MRNIIIVTAVGISLLSCTTSREQLFMSMSDAELDAYNASLPERRQIVCEESVRRGTVGLVRKVCTGKSRMARLTQPSASSTPSFINGYMGFDYYGGNRSDSAVLPQVFFSPPPPGYDRPVIHVVDPR